MHFCTAYVAIAGDRDQVVCRNFFNPVSWPEIEVLRFIHGDEAVTEVKPFVYVERAERAERERLVLNYGIEYVTACLGARNARIDMDAPEADIAYGSVWKNPLTQLEETIESAPALAPLDEPDHKLARPVNKRAAAATPENPF
jgi:hypothetical protein